MFYDNKYFLQSISRKILYEAAKIDGANAIPNASKKLRCDDLYVGSSNFYHTILQGISITFQ